jgi:putative ABC transport system ATP-binding protein
MLGRAWESGGWRNLGSGKLQAFDLGRESWKEKNSMHAAPILHIQGLTKSYVSGGGTLTVLNDVSFSVLPKASCAIVGPSGSGKTTLLGLCAGLDVPSSGSVLLDGHRLEEMDEDGRARMRNQVVGFVFQNFQLIPTLTALENVMIPMEIQGRRHATKSATELLERVGLADRLHHYPVQLSGGEQQRVAVARAFINQPRILFADEPTGNLDAETGHRIVETLFAMNAAFGTTLVLITHDLELASRADWVIRLRGGQILEQGPANAVRLPGVADSAIWTGASH